MVAVAMIICIALFTRSALSEYYLAGDSDSDDGDFSDDFGDVDFGIIKFKDPALQIKDSTVCNVNDFVAVQDTIKDVCGNDSVLVAYKPVLIKGPLSDVKKIDTIFTGQNRPFTRMEMVSLYGMQIRR